MGDESVQMTVRWTLHIQAILADLVDGFVVDHKSAVGVLQSGVGGQDAVVGLDDSSRDLNEVAERERGERERERERLERERAFYVVMSSSFSLESLFIASRFRVRGEARPEWGEKNYVTSPAGRDLQLAECACVCALNLLLYISRS